MEVLKQHQPLHSSGVMRGAMSALRMWPDCAIDAGGAVQVGLSEDGVEVARYGTTRNNAAGEADF